MKDIHVDIDSVRRSAAVQQRIINEYFLAVCIILTPQLNNNTKKPMNILIHRLFYLSGK